MNLSGNLLDYFVAFWSGVLVSFSPCVYPLIPITVSVIGGVNTSGTKLRGFVISSIYVLGIATTYCLFATMAALTGKLFGSWQNSPVAFIILGNILILFALVLFDVIPMASLGLTPKIKLKNLWSLFLLGIVSGLAIGPCTAPILGSLLVYVGSKQNVLHGVSLLFSFSIGVGASLVLAGTFSGFLSSLPKSGVWLKWIKIICGFILLIIGEFFLIKGGRLMQ